MKNLFVAFALLWCSGVQAQIRFSIAPDLSLMRNFSPKQKFWTLGETVQAQFHFTNKETGYVWLSFYTPGKFKNNFIAAAKSAGTSPSSIPFKATAKWRNNEISLGWKHFLKGSFDLESGWSLYSITGFGLMFTKVENAFEPGIDTSLYNTPVLTGIDEFKRLTIDLGLGIEYPLGGDFFIYGDARTWIPTTSYPSPYLHNNKNVPLPFIISAGLRILFNAY